MKVNSCNPRSKKASKGKAKHSKHHRRVPRRKSGFHIPVTSSPDLLPLYNPEVSWKRFEAFCRGFVSYLTGIEEVHSYGKQGSKQKGIDLYADLSTGERWAFQCKQVKKFTNGDARKAIKKTKYTASRYFILVSCDVDSTVRDVFPKGGKWDLWDVDDISRRVRTLEPDTARKLVETTFGPLWRKAFLGAAGLTPFVAPKVYFRRWMNSRRLFNHTWNLVGRSDHIERLRQFAKSKKDQIAILSGRGGIGKTKILQAFSSSLHAISPKLHGFFVEEGVNITIESLDELPSSPCIVFVDDVHRNESLPTLLAYIHQRQRPIKLVLSTRSHGTDSLISSVTRAGYDSSEIVLLDEIKELTLLQVEELARQVLGRQYKQFASALAQATSDCPLVTVVGGKLLASKQVNPALLANHEEFRTVVLDRFSEVLTGHLTEAIAPELCRKLLDLIAGLSPIPIKNQKFKQAVAEFLGIDGPTLECDLSVLETAGVLLRRGYTLRITPDVLADHILHRSCITTQGQITGYAEKLFEKFAAVSADKLLRNLAELDWRIYQSGGQASALMNNIWDGIEQAFHAAGHFKRYAILDVLKKTAYFQPARMLKIVNDAMQHPAGFTEDEEIDSPYQSTHETVLRELPELLQSIGYNLDYLPRCCELLWQLGKDDRRPLHSNTDHGVRILSDLAGYDLEKPLQINKILLEAAAKWLDAADAHNHVYSPLEIVDSLLAKSDYSARSKGYGVSFIPFHVSPNTTASLREEALGLIRRCAKSDSPKVISRAIQSLDKALEGPRAYFSMQISADERAIWVPEQLKVLDILGEIARELEDPILKLEVIKAVRWEATNSPTLALKKKATEVISQIEESYQLRLCRVLGDNFDRTLPPIDSEDDDRGYEKERERSDCMIQEVAQEFLGRHAIVADGFSELISRLDDFKTTGIFANPAHLLGAIGKANISYAAQLSEMIIDNPDVALGYFLPTLLLQIGDSNRQRALSLCQRALEKGHSALAFAVARSYNCSNWLTNPAPEEVQLIKNLTAHHDPSVKGQAITSLRNMKDGDTALAIGIAVSVNIGNSEDLAKQLTGIFARGYGIPLDALEGKDLSALIAKLEVTTSIDDHIISKFLDSACKKAPALVIDLLLNRIDHGRTGADKEYHPLPYLGFNHALSGIVHAPNYVVLLREIRNRATIEDWHTGFWLPKLFKQVSNNFSEVSMQVLEEWDTSGEADKITAVACLVSEAPNNFVISHSTFCINLLRKSHVVSNECHQRIRSSLFSSAISGARSGIAGQPMPEDLALKSKASEVVAQLMVGSPERNFYESLVQYATSQIDDLLAKNEELFDH